MTKPGRRKHRKRSTVLHVEDVSEDDTAVADVKKSWCPAGYGQGEDWDNEDGKWGSPPSIGKPTLVRVKLLIGHLQDLDTVRGTLSIRVGVWCFWRDPRLVGRTRMDPLPAQLWSPRLTVGESLGDFKRSTCEFTLAIGTLVGDMYSLTWYEGSIKNPMDLHSFPLDTDTVELTFFASECFKRNGDTNVNYKTDYRLLFEGWMFDAFPSAAPYGWKLVSTHVRYVWDEHCQDVLQIRFNLVRQVNFYFFKVVIPLFLITCLNFMGFSLETLGERLSNNVSLFLSALALLYVVGQDLPHTTFLTAIDRIVLVTLILIFTTSIHFVYLWRVDRVNKLTNQLYKMKNISEESGSEDEDSTAIQEQIDAIKDEWMVVLSYFFVYITYIIIEFIQLMIRRFRKCQEYKKNIDSEKVFDDGVGEQNAKIIEDTAYKIPAHIIIDPFKIVLVKKNHPGALIFLNIPSKAEKPVELLLSSGKALVMSSKPEFKYDERDVKWMTIGSPLRAIQVIFDPESFVRVTLFTFIDQTSCG